VKSVAMAAAVGVVGLLPVSSALREQFRSAVAAPSSASTSLAFVSLRGSPLLETSASRKQSRAHRRQQSSPGVKAALIEPDGGVLVDLIVPAEEREAKIAEAETLPQIHITKIDLEWVHVVSEGWASPLRGFMRQAEYLQALHFNAWRLEDGSLVNMSIPIVLAIDEAQKQDIGSQTAVTLVGPSGKPIAILRK
jgi:3'-phosphoadenosine 5'-phosphosulfate synthase